MKLGIERSLKSNPEIDQIVDLVQGTISESFALLGMEDSRLRLKIKPRSSESHLHGRYNGRLGRITLFVSGENYDEQEQLIHEVASHEALHRARHIAGVHKVGFLNPSPFAIEEGLATHFGSSMNLRAFGAARDPGFAGLTGLHPEAAIQHILSDKIGNLIYLTERYGNRFYYPLGYNALSTVIQPEVIDPSLYLAPQDDIKDRLAASIALPAGGPTDD